MTRKNLAHRCGALLVALAVGFLGSCSLDPRPQASAHQRGDVVSVKTVSAAIGVSGNFGLAKKLTLLSQVPTTDATLRAVQEGVLPVLNETVVPKVLAGTVLEQLRVTYYTKDAQGELLQASGLVLVPYALSGDKLSLPVLSIQHGTQIYRPLSPSLFTTDLLTEDATGAFLSYPESVLGLLFSATGYIVVIPDYAGLGASNESHPYVHLSVANSVVDLLKALPAVLRNRQVLGTSWNQALYLMGYSEGGYATLAAARALQASNDAGDDDVVVTAAAALAGPHDLSATMKALMVADQPSSQPFFLPYTLAAYHAIYPGSVWLPSQTLVAPYDTLLPPLLDGNHTSSEVSAAMPVRAGTTDHYPVDVLQPSFVELLNRPYTGSASADGPVVTALAANDAYRGWVPRMRLRLYHCSRDDLVPRANSDVAWAAFSGAPNLDPVQDVTELAIPGMSVHVAAALPAYLNAFLWIDSLKVNP